MIDHIWHPMRHGADKHGGVFDETLLMLSSGFRSLGYDIPVAKGPAPLSERPLIVCGLVLGALPRRRRRPPITLGDGAVVYNHEQIFEGSPWLNDEYLFALRHCEVWDYSRKNIEELAKMGIASKHVPVGYVPEHEQFEQLPEAEKDLDVVFVGGANDRRVAVLDGCRQAGLRVEHLTNCFGKARDEFYARAKVVLNIHAYKSAIFETVRVSHLLANGCCVVSEDGPDTEAEAEYAAGVTFGSAQEIPSLCVQLCRDPELRASRAARGQKMMRGMRFDQILKGALG